MKFLLSAVLVCLSIGLGSEVSAAGECLRYEPVKVNLSGRLLRKTYPGPPNFESVAEGDLPETGYYLKLSSPLCTQAQEGEEAGGHQDLQMVQLVLDQEQYEALRPLLGKRVSLEGSLIEASTGHHHTPVLLTVSGWKRGG